MPGVLVAYATKHGSTREVAEAVSKTLRAEGVQAGLRPARGVRGPIGDRDLVVLGAPVCSGRWHGDAHRFLKRHRKELLTVPAAVFGMGPRNPGQEAWQRSRRQLDRALAKRDWLRPLSRCSGARTPRRGTVSSDATCGTGTRSGPGRPASVTTRPSHPRAQARPQVRDGRAAGAATGPCCIPRRWSSLGPGAVDRPVPPRYDVAVAHRRIEGSAGGVLPGSSSREPVPGPGDPDADPDPVARRGLAGRRDAATWCRSARPGGLALGRQGGAAGTSRSRAATLRRQAACPDRSAVAGQSWFSLFLRFR